MLPRVESWLFAKNYKLLPYLNSIGDNLPMIHEQHMFIGAIPLCALFASCAILLFQRNTELMITHKLEIISSVVIIFLFFIFTLVIFEQYTLYQFSFYLLPGLDAIRGVARLILFLAFVFAILSAFVITYIANLSKLNYVFRTVIIAVIVLFGVFEQLQFKNNIVTYSKSDAQLRYVNKIPQYKDFDIFINYTDKPSNSYFLDEIDAMFLSLILNKPTLNGYSGFSPQNYTIHNDNNYTKWIIDNIEGFKHKKILLMDKQLIQIIDIDDTYAKMHITAQTTALNSYSYQINITNIKQDDNHSATVTLLVKNNSNDTWHCKHTGLYGIAISYSITNKLQNNQDFEQRVFLPYDIEPNESFFITFKITDLQHGQNKILFDMVQDGVSWFRNKNNTIVNPSVIIDIK
jgi:hypothetical protein